MYAEDPSEILFRPYFVLCLVCNPATVCCTREKLAHLSEEERKRHWDYNINKVYIVCILNYVMAPG